MCITNQSNQTENEIQAVEEISTDVNSMLNSQVILFNDDVHFFEEVIAQLMLACKHSFEKAEELTYEINKKGKAKVYENTFENCIKASNILESIKLRTQIIC